MLTTEQYNRMKGAPWFPLLHKRDVMLLGQGGIGSWAALALARTGVNLYTYDMDTYEGLNLSGQMVRQQDIGKLKTTAVKEIIAEFSPDCVVETAGKYLPESMSNDIVICGFDNMVARKLSFVNWKKHVLSLPPAEQHNCFFQDGRLNVEQIQIFNISGNRHDLMTRYETAYLFDDDVVAEAECTFKQTSHTAMMIAGHMVAFLTNWAFNSSRGKSIRTVPFYFEYVTPLNMTTSNDRL